MHIAPSGTNPTKQSPAFSEKDWAADDQFLFDFALEQGRSVLQIAYGSGALAAKLACAGLDVVALDSDPTLLAKGLKCSKSVTWVGADARTVRLGRQFDTAIIAGHAFQSFTTNTDQILLLQTIAAHLKPGGRFSFGTRNPKMRPWEKWMNEEPLPDWAQIKSGKVMHWRDLDGPDEQGLVHLKTHVDTGAERCSLDKSRRYVEQGHLAALLEAVGLCADCWQGAWSEKAAEAGEGPEIIVTGYKH
ncbi:class I SAM-dependent methyltransferase [Pseudovibrio flavus]|uniref:class I SAM-dependent methyltransferase n=1 Tax=Pseudovibrio flavus TaxID=2529854 RepID=UPI00211CE191|nr:class I SAM-dependent methyltransferase [Pseudovibrio flavus]